MKLILLGFLILGSINCFAKVSNQCRNAAQGVVLILENYNEKKVTETWVNIAENDQSIRFEDNLIEHNASAILNEVTQNQYGLVIPVVSRKYLNSKFVGSKKYQVNLYVDKNGICDPTKVSDL